MHACTVTATIYIYITCAHNFIVRQIICELFCSFIHKNSKKKMKVFFKIFFSYDSGKKMLIDPSNWKEKYVNNLKVNQYRWSIFRTKIDENLTALQHFSVLACSLLSFELLLHCRKKKECFRIVVWHHLNPWFDIWLHLLRLFVFSFLLVAIAALSALRCWYDVWEFNTFKFYFVYRHFVMKSSFWSGRFD